MKNISKIPFYPKQQSFPNPYRVVLWPKPKPTASIWRRSGTSVVGMLQLSCCFSHSHRQSTFSFRYEDVLLFSVTYHYVNLDVSSTLSLSICGHHLNQCKQAFQWTVMLASASDFMSTLLSTFQHRKTFLSDNLATCWCCRLVTGRCIHL